MNAGVHWVDFALAALRNDEVQSVFAACDVSTHTYRDGIEVETEAVTYAVTRSGVRLVMQTGDDVRPARGGKDLVYRFYGSLGSIEFWGWEDCYWLRIGGPAHSPAPVTVTPPLTATAHQVYLEMLADMVEKGKPQNELAELSLRALEICQAAYVSPPAPLCGAPAPFGFYPAGPRAHPARSGIPAHPTGVREGATGAGPDRAAFPETCLVPGHLLKYPVLLRPPPIVRGRAPTGSGLGAKGAAVVRRNGGLHVKSAYRRHPAFPPGHFSGHILAHAVLGQHWCPSELLGHISARHSGLGADWCVRSDGHECVRLRRRQRRHRL